MSLSPDHGCTGRATAPKHILFHTSTDFELAHPVPSIRVGDSANIIFWLKTSSALKRSNLLLTTPSTDKSRVPLTFRTKKILVQNALEVTATVTPKEHSTYFLRYSSEVFNVKSPAALVPVRCELIYFFAWFTFTIFVWTSSKIVSCKKYLVYSPFSDVKFLPKRLLSMNIERSQLGNVTFIVMTSVGLHPRGFLLHKASINGGEGRFALVESAVFTNLTANQQQRVQLFVRVWHSGNYTISYEWGNLKTTDSLKIKINVYRKCLRLTWNRSPVSYFDWYFS